MVKKRLTRKQMQMEVWVAERDFEECLVKTYGHYKSALECAAKKNDMTEKQFLPDCLVIIVGEIYLE
jgi:hypothetical protein